MEKTNISNRAIIWILGSLSTVTPFAIDLYLPAFASIATDFKTSTAAISLSVSSYFVGMAIGQILYGPLLDRYGRKRPLYVGLLIFILTSVGCMLSWNVTSLVVFRFFQALSGSVAWVGAVAMVRDFFPDHRGFTITCAYSWRIHRDRIWVAGDLHRLSSHHNFHFDYCLSFSSRRSSA